MMLFNDPHNPNRHTTRKVAFRMPWGAKFMTRGSGKWPEASGPEGWSFMTTEDPKDWFLEGFIWWFKTERIVLVRNEWRD